MRLIPRDARFFETFDQLGRHIAEAAALVRELFEAPDRLTELVGRVKAVEHAADVLSHAAIEQLDAVFVTPLDREDIHLLITRLDNVVDLLDGAARRAEMYQVRDVPPHARQIAAVVEQAAQEVRTAAGALRRPAELLPYVRRVKTLEEQADLLYHDAVRTLFAPDADGAEPNALHVMKWKDVYDTLENAADECNHVAQVLESVAIKQG